MAEQKHVSSMLDMPLSRQEYQGPGKVSSAIGSGLLWSIPGSLLFWGLTGRITHAIVRAVKDTPYASDRQIAEKILPKLKSSYPYIIAGEVAAAFGLVYGAIRGWSKAAHAEQQFYEVQDERNVLHSSAKILDQQNAALNDAVGQLGHAVVKNREALTEMQHKLAETKHAGHERHEHKHHEKAKGEHDHEAHTATAAEHHAISHEVDVHTKKPHHDLPKSTVEAHTITKQESLSVPKENAKTKESVEKHKDANPGHASKEAAHTSHTAAQEARAAHDAITTPHHAA